MGMIQFPSPMNLMIVAMGFGIRQNRISTSMGMKSLITVNPTRIGTAMKYGMMLSLG